MKNKQITLGLAVIASLTASSSAATVFSADFESSTATTTGTTITGLTSASNLDAGTATGSWSGLSSAAGNGSNSGIDVSSDTLTADTMSGDWMLIGMAGNGTTHLTSATMDLSDAILLNGATISLNLNMRNSGGQNGGLLVTGYTCTGTALFAFTGGNGGSPYGQKELATSSDPTGTRDNTHNDLWTTNFDGATISLTLGAGNYTLTGDGGTTDLAGSYFATGDLAKITFDAIGSKALWGVDNISVEGTIAPVPEPSSTALFGLGGLALIMRRRK